MKNSPICPGGIVCRSELPVNGCVAATQVELDDALFEKGLVELLTNANPECGQLEAPFTKCVGPLGVEKNLCPAKMSPVVATSKSRCNSRS